MNNFLLPLVNQPQQFEIDLAGVAYLLTSRWNDANEAGWVIDIADSNNVPIVCNIPMVTGVDLLAGLAYLGINGSLFVFTDGDEFAVPTLDNLGDKSNVYFQTDVSA